VAACAVRIPVVKSAHMLKRAAKLRTIMVAAVVLAALTQLADPRMALARAGGGGSSSDSSSSSSDSFSSGSSRERRGSAAGALAGGINLPPWTAIPILISIPLLVFLLNKAMQAEARRQEQKRKELAAGLAAAAAADPSWQPSEIEKRAGEVFLAFQKAWGELDTETMRGLLTKAYLGRMVLELSVLKNLGRRNLMENVQLMPPQIIDFHDDADDAKDRVTLLMRATAKDTIMDVESGSPLHVDTSSFREYWDFAREDGVWKLDVIRQSTESRRLTEGPIAAFAARNGFFFDPDFGWLMLPAKGVLFGKSRFGTADVNNHVIGYYRNKIVEFYTYIPDKEEKDPKNYVVAQAILPISYRDILIRKKTKGLWFASKPAGLRQMSLEFGDFNEKFEVFAHPEDQINSLELLTPNFMLKIYDLPYTLNIELVGNTLYLYTLQRDVSFDRMLEILSWAFDEMKM
ncbi:MAG TPA: TIM44-like domain-containing protein, partial [Patescibacteria group bacterium]|nr:TIM44-like domain-containing protein [Patescibacteria group bacterium]